MNTLSVKVRMWHGGVFVDSRSYSGIEYLEMRDYDVFENEESCFDELMLLPDHDYARVLRYGFRDKPTGYFKIVNCDEADNDFVTYALQFVNNRNILNVYCECEELASGLKKRNDGVTVGKEKGRDGAVVFGLEKGRDGAPVGLEKGRDGAPVEREEGRDGAPVEREEGMQEVEKLDSGTYKKHEKADPGRWEGKTSIVNLEAEDEDSDEEDPDFELDDELIENDPVSDDGMEDDNFSDDDEEFLEARRNKRVNINKWRENNKVKENTNVGSHNQLEKEMEHQYQHEKENECEEENQTEKGKIAADFIDIDDEIDSDASYESMDEDGHKIQKTKVYNRNIAPKDLKLELGLRFFDPKECQEVVRHWAIANGYNIRWTKSSKGKLTAKCVDGCSWRMYASRIHGEPTCIIKTLYGKHTCVRAQFNRQANSRFVASHFLPKFRSCQNITIKQMQAEIRLTYGCTVKSMICYRGKWKALEQIRGTFKDHYAKLRSYISELMRNDRVGHFEVKTYLDRDDKPVFERLYIGFAALPKGFLVGCRKYIGFDACFLKTVLGGALLAAVSKDCNNKMYPIAWAVVEKENESSWTWFFERLFDDLNIDDGLGWTFMSDKQKV